MRLRCHDEGTGSAGLVLVELATGCEKRSDRGASVLVAVAVTETGHIEARPMLVVGRLTGEQVQARRSHEESLLCRLPGQRRRQR